MVVSSVVAVEQDAQWAWFEGQGLYILWYGGSGFATAAAYVDYLAIVFQYLSVGQNRSISNDVERLEVTNMIAFQLLNFLSSIH